MKNISRMILFLAAFVALAMAQSAEPPLSDTRLTVHTLVREDIFAGYLTNNMDRFVRGEKNIQTLLDKRPDAKAELLAWQGGAALYRAVVANENKRSAEFLQKYQQARDLFSQARQLGPQNGGVAAVTGGSYALFADRLPAENRGAAWSAAYDAYQLLWKFQAADVEKLPVHIRGELLAGLATSAQRTGRNEESGQYTDKILTLLANTPYERVAQQWKTNPKAAPNTKLICLSCHEDGRLAARVAVLNK